MTAIRPVLFSFLLFLLPFNLQHPSLTDALNISYVVSTVVLPGEANSIESVPDHSQHTETTNSSPFLKDVLAKIAARKKWDLEKIRATKLEKPRYAYSKRYDYRIRTGQSDLIVRLSEKLEPWKAFDREVSDFEVAVNEVSSKAVLQTFALDGPLELLVRGDDWLSLLLPNLLHKSPLHPSSSQALTCAYERCVSGCNILPAHVQVMYYLLCFCPLQMLPVSCQPLRKVPFASCCLYLGDECQGSYVQIGW